MKGLRGSTASAVRWKSGLVSQFLGRRATEPAAKRPIMATASGTFVASVIMPDREGRFSISLRDGRIAEIEPERHDSSTPAWLALPGFANLHAHVDRAFTVTSFRPRSFADALAASAKARAAFTSADVERRATIFLQRSVAHGVSRVRTHTDVDPVVALKSMEGVLAAKRAMAGKIDVDVIAFATSRNDLAEPEAVARLRSAIALKPDFLGLSVPRTRHRRVARSRRASGPAGRPPH